MSLAKPREALNGTDSFVSGFFLPDVFEIQPCYSLRISSSFLLSLSSISLYGCTSLFIHSPVDIGVFPVWGDLE